MTKLLTIFLILICTCVYGQNKYVAPWGKDLIGSGSFTNPYKTINYANSQNIGAAQITFKLKPGIYNESVNINILSNRTIENDSIGEVVIDASFRDSSVAFKHIFAFNSVTNDTIRGITFRNLIGPSCKAIFILGNTKNLTIQNCKFKNIGWTNSIYLNRRPPNSSTIAGVIHIHGTMLDSIFNINISKNKIDSCCTGWGEALTIKGNTSKFIVDYDTISRVSNIGIDIAGNFDTSFFTPAQRLYNHARNGTISNNNISYCMSSRGIAAGIYLDGSSNCIVKNNKIYKCGTGLSLGAEATIPVSGIVGNHIVNNNIVDSCSTSGMYIGTGVLGSFVKNCFITNNSFINNGTSEKINGIDSISEAAYILYPIEFWTSGSKGTILLQNNNSTTFQNNIITTLATRTAITGMGNLSSTNFKCNYNLYNTYNNISQSLFYFPGGHSINGNIVPNLVFNTIASFTANSQQDSSSIFANPLFQNNVPHIYKPSQCSPSINKGNYIYDTALNGTIDYADSNRKFDSRLDIGAYEYQAFNIPCSFTGIATPLCDSITNKITLRWNKPTNADTFSVKLGSTILTNNIIDTFFIHQPSVGGSYTYDVIAKNSSGTNTISIIAILPNCVKSFTFDTIIAQCKNDTAFAKLNWTAAINATSYSIYRNNSFYKNIIGGNTITYIDTITNGITYSYRIRAKNNNDSVLNNNGIKSITNSLCPGKFSLTFVNSQCNGIQSEMNLSWTVSTNAVKYSIYRDTGSGNPNKFYKQINLINYVDTVTTLKIYSYKIVALSNTDSVLQSNSYIAKQALDCIVTSLIFINNIPFEISVTPNPTQNFIKIFVKSSTSFNISSIQIFDITGKLILFNNYNINNKQFQKTIDLSNYRNSVYTILLKINNTKIFKKVLKL